MLAFIFATIPFLYFLTLRRWTWIGLVAGVANLTMVLMHVAAPIRCVLDPNDNGYCFGFLHADKGFAVALIACGLFLATMLSASIAVRNRPGLPMLIVATTSAFHLYWLGGGFLDLVDYNPRGFSLELDENLTIPHTVVISVWIAVFVLPFLLATPWALRRAFETE